MSAGTATCAIPTVQTDGWELSTPEASGFNATTLCMTLTAIAQGRDNIHGIVSNATASWWPRCTAAAKTNRSRAD
jgi:hypothetical protein